MKCSEYLITVGEMPVFDIFARVDGGIVLIVLPTDWLFIPFGITDHCFAYFYFGGKLGYNLQYC